MNDNIAQKHDLIFRRLLDQFPLGDAPGWLLFISLVLLAAAGLVLLLGRERQRSAGSRLWGWLGLALFLLPVLEGLLFAGNFALVATKHHPRPELMTSLTPWLVILNTCLGLSPLAVAGSALLLGGERGHAVTAHLRGGVGAWLILLTVGQVAAAACVVTWVAYAGKPVPGWAWHFVWVPIVALGAIYVIAQYIRDVRYMGTVGYIVGPLMALARLGVYALLAFFFLLPAWQYSDETQQHSKVIVMFDGSLSQTQVHDDIPPTGVALSAMPTRTDKTIEFLLKDHNDPKSKASVNFLQALQKTNPVTVYRFGDKIDPEFMQIESERLLSKTQLIENQIIDRAGSSDPKHAGAAWAKSEWADWLVHDARRKDAQIEQVKANPANAKDLKDLQDLLDFERVTFDSTNVAGSVLDVLKQEGGNMVQGIVVFTDGRSTEESAQAYRELADISRQKKIPIFAVRVGEERPKVELEIVDVGVPEQVRPDDPFEVKVRVAAKGMSAEKVPVTVDVYAPGQDPKAKDAKPYHTFEDAISLSHTEPIQGVATIKIEPEELGEKPEDQPPPKSEDKKPGETKKDEKKPEPPSDGKKRLRIGDWHFVARIKRDPREIFPNEEHSNRDAPGTVKVIDRQMNVLLFASAPTHEYQFLRTMLVREKDKGRVKLSIYVQPAPGLSEPRNGIVQDVEPNRLLSRFPYLYQDSSLDGGENSDAALSNLQNYDLIVTFDPDWMALGTQVLNNVKSWVEQGGGLIAVGGPINTTTLARPNSSFRDALKPILEVYPVILADNRIQDLERSTRDPYPLHFMNKNITPDMEFLNLAEEKDEGGQNKLLSGWNEFFYGDKPEGNPPQLMRGIYNFYPVQLPKKGALVIASFSDPNVPRLKDREQSEMPYLVINPVVGRGKTVWIGSGELWRLRGYREAFHERFWVKLCRYIGSTNMTKQNTRVVPYMAKRLPAKSIAHMEVQIIGKDLKPLPQNARAPELEIDTHQAADDAKDDRNKKKKFYLKPKPVSDEWRGWFEVDFPVKEPGNGYEYTLTIPDLGDEKVYGKFDVLPSNPELDNTAPDLKALYYSLASDAGEVRNRVPDEVKREMTDRLRRPYMVSKDEARKAGDRPEEKQEAVRDTGMRLYFDLNNADLIPRLMTTAEKTQTNKGKTEDLIYRFSLPLELWSMWVTGGLFCFMVLLFAMQFIMDPRGVSLSWFVWRIVGLAAAIVVGAAVLLFGLHMTSIGQTVLIPAAMMAVVILLCMEWLTRKLLRMA